MHRLFSCGYGGSFALGHGNKESCSHFKQIDYFTEEINVGGIKTVACGLTHSGCVTEDGTVYLWGVTG